MFTIILTTIATVGILVIAKRRYEDARTELLDLYKKD